MARKHYSPEDFIREHIARGCTAEEIVLKAQKRDKGFLNIVKETLQHATLIEKIENQVQNNHQAQLNFEDGNYSSDAIKRQISEQKANKTKHKHNGRSNLPINTDIQMDDLEAPLQTLQPEEKKVAFKNKPNKSIRPAHEEYFSIFDTVPPQPQNENKANDLKTEEFPITPIHSQVKIEIPKAIEKNHAFQSVQDEIASLQKELDKKDKLLAGLNKNIGLKEAQIHSVRAVSEDKKMKLLRDMTKLKRRCFAFQIGFVSVCVLFFVSIGFSRLKTNADNTSYHSVIAQSDPHSITEPETAQNLNPLLIEEDYIPLVQTESISHNDISQQPVSQLPIEVSPTILDPIADTPSSITSQTYTVKNGDNWWKIAKNHWGPKNAHKYKKIVEYNRLRSEKLKQGQILKIPALAELD